MKKLSVLLLTFLATVSMAMAVPTTNWGQLANPGKCDTSGKPVINVVQDIKNTIDGGQQSGWWAYDNLTRQVQAFKTGENSFCLLIQNEGEFSVPDFLAGETSPQGGELTGEEEGTFQGDIYIELTGSLKENPLWGTQGRIETLDYGCDLQEARTNGPGSTCDRPATTWNAYFDVTGFGDFAWDYQYTAQKNCGRLVQTSSGPNLGDITCENSPAGGPGN